MYIKSDDGRLRSGPGPDGGEGDDDIDESSPIRRCSIKNMITFLSEREKKWGMRLAQRNVVAVVVGWNIMFLLAHKFRDNIYVKDKKILYLKNTN